MFLWTLIIAGVCVVISHCKSTYLKCSNQRNTLYNTRLTERNIFLAFIRLSQKEETPLATSLTQFWKAAVRVIPTATGDDAEVFGTLPQD